MKRILLNTIGLAAAAFLIAGCPAANQGPNAFLTLAEEFGAESSLGSDDDGTGTGGGGIAAEIPFRQTMSVTLANNATTADLEVSMAAWVLPSSLRIQSQQDALLEDGYVEINAELRLGTFTLPPGTYVRDGGGFAGAERFLITAAVDAPVTETRSLVTPDVLLIYNEAPRNCESVAFQFLVDGEPVVENLIRNATTTGATNTGGKKTLAQIDAYQCSPFKPGLYFKSGGGARQSNEFFEGQNVTFNFDRTAQNGIAAIVDIE